MDNETWCKICGSLARRAMATRWECADGVRMEVDYLRCSSCDFLFTTTLDDWTNAQVSALYAGSYWDKSGTGNRSLVPLQKVISIARCRCGKPDSMIRSHVIVSCAK